MKLITKILIQFFNNFVWIKSYVFLISNDMTLTIIKYKKNWLQESSLDIKKTSYKSYISIP